MTCRVVVTGIGLVTALGCGREPTWTALVEGRSGIVPLTLPELAGLSLIGAPVPGFAVRDYVRDMKAVKTMTRQTQLAVAAASMACEQAGAMLAAGPRIGVYLGAGFEDTALEEIAPAVEASLDAQGQFNLQIFGRSGYQRLSPLFGIRKLPNMALSHVSIAYNAQGPNALFSPSAASGVQAIAEGFEAIRCDRADVALVGGCDTKLDLGGYLRYGAMKLLSPSAHAGTACRPFHAQANGIVLAEAGAFLVLESEEHARARTAVPLAEIAGSGTTFASPERNQDRAAAALRTAMTQALEEAQVTVDELDLIFANGASTQLLDEIEGNAIGSLLQGRLKDVPVATSKAAIGHSIAAAGAVDAALTICALHAQTVPPTLASTAAASSLRLTSAAYGHPMRTAIVNAIGFEGTYASLVLRRMSALN